MIPSEIFLSTMRDCAGFSLSAFVDAHADDAVVSINCDKSVPVEYLVHIMKVCNKLKAKAVLATQPE